MKPMNVIEMQGFLQGKCLPRDIKVNETNAEYLVRKYNELEVKCAALAEESENKDRCLPFFASVIKSGEEWTSVCQNEYEKAQKSSNGIAFLAEIRAQGVEMYISELLTLANDWESKKDNDEGVWRCREMAESASKFADHLRRGNV